MTLKYGELWLISLASSSTRCCPDLRNIKLFRFLNYILNHKIAILCLCVWRKTVQSWLRIVLHNYKRYDRPKKVLCNFSLRIVYRNMLITCDAQKMVSAYRKENTIAWNSNPFFKEMIYSDLLYFSSQ